MYPHVTQFQTRDLMILDELRLQEERRWLTRRASPRTRRAPIPIRVAQMLKVAPVFEGGVVAAKRSLVTQKEPSAAGGTTSPSRCRALSTGPYEPV